MCVCVCVCTSPGKKSVCVCVCIYIYLCMCVCVCVCVYLCGSLGKTVCMCGEGDPSGPGIELMSPALAGGFSTTEPPGKPWIFILMLGHFRKIRDKLFSQSRYNQSWHYFRDIAF